MATAPPVVPVKHKVEFSATVNDDNDGGKEYYFESHRMGCDTTMLGWIVAELKQFADRCEKLEEHEPHRDNENLSVIFKHSIDGVAKPDIVIKGGSYHELMIAEKEWHEIGGRLLKFGEERAKNKGKGKPV